MTQPPRKELQNNATLLDRTLRNLRQGWRDIADSTFGAGAREPRPSLPRDDARQLGQQMRECLEARGGEVSARARAAELGRTYLGLNAEGRKRFLRILAVDFDADHAAVDQAMRRVSEADGRASRRRAESTLRQTLDAPRVKLLTQFNGLPEGVKFLVDLRAELLPMAKKDAALVGLASDLKDLLDSWFDIGFLELRRITWDSPASLLERVVEYEAVHAISSWQDLKNRLDLDRRLFAFFHPRMPDEPLIFVEVALVNGIADNIQALLDPNAPVSDPKKADTAVFYSISNAQAGLAGISFGGFLIKRVVDQLTAEYKGLKTFATLSPVPGFHRWLDERLVEAQERTGKETHTGLLTAAERKALAVLANPVAGAAGLSDAIAGPGWQSDPERAAAFKGPLMRLCAEYLLQARREAGGARDPVAHFHLANGARLERINWLADTSGKGLRQSAGIMVNYRYRLERIEEYHEAYTGDGQIAAASAVKSLLKS